MHRVWPGVAQLTLQWGSPTAQCLHNFFWENHNNTSQRQGTGLRIGRSGITIRIYTYIYIGTYIYTYTYIYIYIYLFVQKKIENLGIWTPASVSFGSGSEYYAQCQWIRVRSSYGDPYGDIYHIYHMYHKYYICIS